MAKKGEVLVPVLPESVTDLRRLIRACEQRIHELEWERLNKEPCFCDRYTCSRCQELAVHRAFYRSE